VEDVRKSDVTKRYTEWQATAIFYSVVHLVDLFVLQCDGLELKSHPERSKYIENPKNRLEPIWFQYRDLSKVAYEARYKGRQPSDSDVNFYLNEHRQIAAHIDPLLAANRSDKPWHRKP